MKKEKFIFSGAAAGACTGICMNFLKSGGYIPNWPLWLRCLLAGLIAWALFTVFRSGTLYVRNRKAISWRSKVFTTRRENEH